MIVLSVLLGVGLAAAVGFRVFLPFFMMSLAAYFDMWEMSAGFEWMDSMPALVALGTATMVEVFAYFIPWVDNLLDTLAVPAATIGGTAMMATTLGEHSPMMQWGIGIIAGGGTAGLIKTATSGTRLASSAGTGGLGNPIISLGETIGAILMSILAIVAGPVAGAIALAILGYAIYRIFVWYRSRNARITIS